MWAGSLMKLNVQCQDYNPNTTKTAYENHFILLKFDGVFQDSLEEVFLYILGPTIVSQ